MDFRELVYVMTVAEEGNMTKAAEKLYVAQPTLSQTVSAVEKKYGLKLFKRHPQGVTLTQAGETYIEYAKKILAIRDELDIELKRISRHGLGKIRIGVPSFLSMTLLPQLLPKLSKQFPDNEFEIIEEDSSPIPLEERVIRGDLEVAILRLPSINETLSTELCFTEKILIAASSENQICAKVKKTPRGKYGYISPEALEDEKFILTPKLSQLRNTAENFFRINGIRPNIELVISNIDTCISLAAGNVGITIVPEHYITSSMIDRGICFFETDDTLRAWRIGVGTAPKKEVDSQVALVAETIRDTLIDHDLY